MKKKLLLLLCFCLMGVNLIVAQISKVTGVITSADDGQPVIGASVLIKDTGIGMVNLFYLTFRPTQKKSRFHMWA